MAAFDDIEDLVIPHDVLSYRGKTFELRPLSVAQIVWIVRNYGGQLSPLYTEAVGGKLPADMAAIAVRMGEDFSAVGSSIIASSMGKVGNENALQIIAALPLSVQIEALDKIMRLTLEAEGGLGNVVEIIIRALQGLRPLLHPET